jgi:transposase
LKRCAWCVTARASRPRRKILGISTQTLNTWIKADDAGKLNGAGKQVSAEQMEIARPRAELARVKMERDILEKATAYFAKVSA